MSFENCLDDNTNKVLYNVDFSNINVSSINGSTAGTAGNIANSDIPIRNPS